MKLQIYQIDAFASKVFEGNPAAVCTLEKWLDDALMQKIAMKNDLVETAFFVKNDTRYEIRWFTPTKEVDLCGHATLASAHVIFNFLDTKRDAITFDSKSGPLTVTKEKEFIKMDFPQEAPTSCETPQAILDAFSLKPIEVLKSVDYIVVFDDYTDLTLIYIDLEALKKLDLRGVCITCKDRNYDFISRMFAPNYGINEDSVTGSAYTQLMPYWVEKLGSKVLKSKQVSSRGGELLCELKDDRVYISGKAVSYLCGEIEI